MNIRKLDPDDAAAYWKVRYEALLQEPHAFGRSAEEHAETSAQNTAEQIRSLQSGSFYFGAFAGEELVAIVSLIRERGMKERHKAHIYGFYLKPGHRGAGIGRALIQKLIDVAREDASLEQLLLAVGHTQVAAHKLYDDLGFRPYGTEPRALKVGSQYVDETLMILRLR